MEEFKISDDGKTLLGYTGRNPRVSIPEGIQAIGRHAFFGAPISVIELPSTLRTIHEGAFVLCSVKEYSIPASVEYIAHGAFSWCSQQSIRDYLKSQAARRRGLHSEGPVYISVANENERYRSENGSLIETTGGESTLLSLYYEGRTFLIPEGTTRVAQHCISYTHREIWEGDRADLRLILPLALTTVDAHAFSSLHLPKGAPLRFDNVCDEYPRLSQVTLGHALTNIDRTFLHTISLPTCEVAHQGSPDEGNKAPDVNLLASVEIDPLNPRYAAPNGIWHDAASFDHLGHGGTEPPLERPAAPEMTRYVRRVAGPKRRRKDLLYVDFPALLELPNGEQFSASCKKAWPVLQEGDVLAIEVNHRSKTNPIATLFGQPIGICRYSQPGNPFQDHPSLRTDHRDIMRDLDIEDIETHSVRIGRGKNEIAYSFVFSSDDTDAEAEIDDLLEPSNRSRCAAQSCPFPELMIKKALTDERLARSRGKKQAKAAPTKTPRLNDVLKQYSDLGGTLPPYATVNAIARANDGAPLYSASITVHFAFDLKGAEHA